MYPSKFWNTIILSMPLISDMNIVNSYVPLCRSLATGIRGDTMRSVSFVIPSIIHEGHFLR